MGHELANFFGLVVIFGVALILICIHREDEIGILMAEKFRFRIEWSNSKSGPGTGTRSQTGTGNQNETKPEAPDENWPFDFPILEGWPPGQLAKLVSSDSQMVLIEHTLRD